MQIIYYSFGVSVDSGKMTGNGDLTWMDDVRSKLTKVYESNAEDLVRVLHYLDEEDKKFYSNTFRPYAPNWNSLKSLLNDKNTFKKYADELIRKSRGDEYEKSLSIKALAVQNQLRNENMMDHSFKISDFFNLQKVWPKLAYLIKAAVIDGIKQFATNEVAAKIGTVSLPNTVTVGVAALTGVQLGYEVYQHIKRWWNGEIDGKWCAKHVVDDTAPIVGGAAGAAAGAFYGSLAGPWGAILGGLVGGFVGGEAANALIDKVTQYIFGLPKSEALSNAYRYLRVPETASNSEVNNAYHKLCLRHHPDKGGDKEEFFILQCHMSVIRQSRGEY